MTDSSLFANIASASIDNDGTTLPATVVERLRQHQGFSLLLPSELGGKQMPFPEFVEFVKSVSVADGSAGWCVSQGSVLASLARFVPRDLAKTIWTSPDVSLANGPPINAGTSRDGDEYILTGSWTYSSGINHANWLLGVATLRKTVNHPGVSGTSLTRTRRKSQTPGRCRDSEAPAVISSKLKRYAYLGP